ncbi:MAG TPA: DUF4388 domain-containing protein [Roseiflexaceae bacterium]|nr:DUF4388 domain-containing protein [Roseiflexaceae bacterium]
MALEGTFEDMTLEDLFQIFRTGAKSGVLLLNGDPARAVIYVSAGRLIDAALVRSPDRRLVATGDEAVIQALQWEQAHFIFRHDPAVSSRPVRIAHDSEWLVLEGMRRRQNPRRIPPHQQITLDSYLELSALPNGAEAGVNLDLNQWRILSQVPVCQSLREICSHTGIAPDQAICTVSQLIAIGLVEVAPPVAPAPARACHTVASALARPLPALESVPPSGCIAQPTGRGLLNAIMRRIRGL